MTLPVSTPARTSLDLGTALTDVRAPVSNELSAVNVEKIKDHLIEIAAAINDDIAPRQSTVTKTADFTTSATAAVYDLNTSSDLTITIGSGLVSRSWIVNKIAGIGGGAKVYVTPASGKSVMNGAANATYALPLSQAEQGISWLISVDASGNVNVTTLADPGIVVGVSKTASFTLDRTFNAIACTTTGGAVTITGPTLLDGETRSWLLFKDSGANKITLSRVGGGKINADNTTDLDLPGSSSAPSQAAPQHYLITAFRTFGFSGTDMRVS